jgi:uncharacterized protein (TIGR02271 family)
MATKDESARSSQNLNQRQTGRTDEKIGQKRTDKDIRPGEEGQLDVIEEKLEVGKRAVEKGGVRVHRTVEERPVEEKVNLREEHVNVERRPVDRPVTAADQRVFTEGTIEVTETREEPVVAKTARVIEEVIVNKDVDQRTETVRDNVHRTDVQVERLEGNRTGQTTGQTNVRRFDEFDTDFRQNFKQSRYAKEYQYDQVAPAYRYGYDIASDRTTYTGDWNAIESNARTRWEQRNPGTWERFKDSIKYAFEKVRPGHHHTM